MNDQRLLAGVITNDPNTRKITSYWNIETDAEGKKYISPAQSDVTGEDGRKATVEHRLYLDEELLQSDPTGVVEHLTYKGSLDLKDAIYFEI